MKTFWKDRKAVKTSLERQGREVLSSRQKRQDVKPIKRGRKLSFSLFPSTFWALPESARTLKKIYGNGSQTGLTGYARCLGYAQRIFSDLVPLVYQYRPKTSESRAGLGEKVLGTSEAEKPIFCMTCDRVAHND